MSQYLPQPNKCYGNGVALDPEIGCEATSGWPAIPEWHKPACQGAKCSEDGGENQCQDDANFMYALKKCCEDPNNIRHRNGVKLYPGEICANVVANDMSCKNSFKPDIQGECKSGQHVGDGCSYVPPQNGMPWIGWGGPGGPTCECCINEDGQIVPCGNSQNHPDCHEACALGVSSSMRQELSKNPRAHMCSGSKSGKPHQTFKNSCHSKTAGDKCTIKKGSKTAPGICKQGFGGNELICAAGNLGGGIGPNGQQKKKPAPSPSPSSSGKGMSTGEIIGISAGSVVGLGLLVTLGMAIAK